jgi:DNA mismatch endonuclease (patch repair protein)
MRANRRRDTQLEMNVRSLLHRRGMRFRVDHPIRIEGRRLIRPDLVFTRARLCVELDGCFWHGCEECSSGGPKSNRNYWGPKIARNKERDLEQARALEEAGWHVIRFWGHEAPEVVADVVQAAYTARLSGVS